MVYADYEYYKNKYYGTLPEDSFNSLILKASKEIDNNVNTRLTERFTRRSTRQSKIYCLCFNWFNIKKARKW